MIKDEVAIVTGCSFTLNEYEIDGLTKNHSWADYLGFKKVFNHGRPGMGNRGMLDRVLYFLLTGSVFKMGTHEIDTSDLSPKVDRIIIALSSWDRFATPYQQFIPSHYWFREKAYETDIKSEHASAHKQMMWWHKKYGNPDFSKDFGKSIIINMIDETLKGLLTVAHICEQKKIPLHVFQMLNPWITTIPENQRSILNEICLKHLVDSQLSYKLHSLKYTDLIGFPFDENIGGREFWISICRSHAKIHISPEDAHPNELGHKLIAEKLLNELNFNLK
tara:strand:+ start:286 stop:1116 length:831 start_codon:yes stop_codon:yes gene_type:complete